MHCHERGFRGRPVARVVVVAACALLVAGCVRQPIRGQPTSGLDRKLSTFAYIEEGDLLTFVVGTKAARDRQTSPYVPFEIALANHGLRELTLTRESFTLVDANGRRYPLATPSELIETYELLDFDREYAELEGIVFNRFAAFARYASQFSPTRTGATIVDDRIALPKGGYIIDTLHFPRPSGELRGQTFELFLAAPELEEPVFLKFEVR